MNQDDIIRMAREAGISRFPDNWGDAWWQVDSTAELERFAALVAAAEREKVAAWMIQRSYATGHGDTTEDLLKELEWQIAERVAAEREACAKVCDEADKSTHPADLADAIRARGQA